MRVETESGACKDIFHNHVVQLWRQLEPKDRHFLVSGLEVYCYSDKGEPSVNWSYGVRTQWLLRPLYGAGYEDFSQTYMEVYMVLESTRCPREKICGQAYCRAYIGHSRLR